jgi:membrane fusion protein, multidrug efflux system
MKNREHALVVSRRAVTALFVASAALLLSACERGKAQHAMPPAQVAVITVEPRNVPAVFEYTGQTAGSREVEVRARVTGILLKRNYREGSTVTEGQSLFTIDPATYQAAVSRAEADLAAAQARLGQAQRNAARMEPLFLAKAVSQKEHDDAVSNEAIAAADVKAAQARLVDARLNLNYTRVESPITGVASRSQRSEGNFVSGPDVLLTTISQINPIHVLFGISDEQRMRMNREVQEKRLLLPKDGRFDVTVKTAEGAEFPRTGRLDFSDIRVSSTTSTSEARAEVPNPNGQLHPGQFVRVILKGAQRPNAIMVPQRAVLEGPQGKFIYVVNEGKAEARPVVVGDWQDDQWIILSGVNPGDKVIVDGVMKIGPGAPVQIADPNAPPPGGPPGAPGSAPPGGSPDTKPAAKPDGAPAAAPAKPNTQPSEKKSSVPLKPVKPKQSAQKAPAAPVPAATEEPKNPTPNEQPQEAPAPPAETPAQELAQDQPATGTKN